MGIAATLAARIGKRPFAPDTLAGLKLWLRGDGPMYSDTARTTLITADASSIAAWDDRSGAGNHVTQATSGKRPTLKTNIVNGQTVARFDGGDTLVSTTASGLDVTTFTWLSVMKRSAATDQGLLVIGSTGSSGNRYWRLLNASSQVLVKENIANVASGAASLGTAAFRALVAQNDDALPVTPTYVANTATYDAFGVLSRMTDGTLLYVYREGTSHFGDVGVLRKRTSSDSGATWSAASTIVSEASVDLRNVGGGVTPTGRMVITYARYTPGTTTWNSIVSRYSDDNGVTWSSGTALTTTGSTVFSPHGSLIRTDDGQLLTSWYGDDGGTTYKVFVVKSSDNGATWGSPIEVISGLGATSSNSKFTESCFAAIGGGVIIGLCRADNGTTFTQVKSTDNGATWATQGLCTFDTWTNVQPNTPPWLIVQGDGVFVFYGQRIALALRAAWSTKSALIAGTSGWGHRADVFTYANADMGYASVVEVGSGRLTGVAYRGVTSADADIEVFTWPKTATIMIDGAHDGTGVTRNSFNSGANVWVGSERDLAEYVNGDLAELLVYSRALSLDEINKVGAYLANRYGLTWA